jgi:hypothetical protein
MNELLTLIRGKEPIISKIANNINVMIQNDEKVILDFDYLDRAMNVLKIAENEYNQFNKELDDLSISDPDAFDDIDRVTSTYYTKISVLLDIIERLMRFQMQITDIGVMLYKRVLKTNEE